MMRNFISTFFKISAIFLGSSVFHSCVNTELKNKALERSHYVIENLDNDSIYSFFSDKYFKKEEISSIATELKRNCDYKNKHTEYVDDFYERAMDSKLDKVSFEYKIFLKCDSLRIILKFELKNEPEIVGFRIEPIGENQMLTGSYCFNEGNNNDSLFLYDNRSYTHKYILSESEVYESKGKWEYDSVAMEMSFYDFIFYNETGPANPPGGVWHSKVHITSEGEVRLIYSREGGIFYYKK